MAPMQMSETETQLRAIFPAIGLIPKEHLKIVIDDLDKDKPVLRDAIHDRYAMRFLRRLAYVNDERALCVRIMSQDWAILLSVVIAMLPSLLIWLLI